MGEVRRGNYIFITWTGDHGPRHVHVYRDGVLVPKWDLENRQPMKGKPTKRGLAVDRGAGGGGPAMKIRSVEANNRRKAFEIETEEGSFAFPYARLRLRPSAEDRIMKVYADPELGREAFTYVLESGREDSVHLDEVLEYNEDPTYLKDLMLYKLTLEARERVAASALSKREIIRRLGTSASQFYRLLDPTNTSKSVGQLVALLHVLDYEVDVVVKRRRRRSA